MLWYSLHRGKYKEHPLQAARTRTLRIHRALLGSGDSNLQWRGDPYITQRQGPISRRDWLSALTRCRQSDMEGNEVND